MAGNIFLKEASAVVFQNDNGGATSDGVEVAAATTLDNRSAGNGAQNFWANFELKAGFASAPTAGKTVDLYLVPATDGTNYADVDTTNHVLPAPCYVGSFVIVLSQTGVQRMPLTGVPLQPLLYKAYLLNKAGQQMSANWGLRAVTAQEQYS